MQFTKRVTDTISSAKRETDIIDRETDTERETSHHREFGVTIIPYSRIDPSFVSTACCISIVH